MHAQKFRWQRPESTTPSYRVAFLLLLYIPCILLIGTWLILCRAADARAGQMMVDVMVSL